jgi:hypothetical protein
LILQKNNQKEKINMYDKGKILFTGFILGALLVISSQFPHASEVPAVIELDHIGDMYEQVTFDHSMHEDVASCATCHHHTIDSPSNDPKCIPCHKASVRVDVVACKGCHLIDPGSAEKMQTAQKEKFFHIDTAGLKRAYHMQCMGCHKEMEVANECKDCHAKKG